MVVIASKSYTIKRVAKEAEGHVMQVLTIDVGGTNVKILMSGEPTPRKFPSGPTLTPQLMVSGVKKLARDWKYDVVSIGYPGLVLRRSLVSEPHNLRKGWVGFDFKRAFGCPVKLINDAAMQAFGSYKGGTLLFLGLGTGLGSALVVEGVVVPMELGHITYKKGTYEDYVGLRGLKRLGKKKWRRHVEYGVTRLITALHADDVVIGGGNAKKMKKLPEGCRAGNNANAFIGGFRLWEKPDHAPLTEKPEGTKVTRSSPSIREYTLPERALVCKADKPR
jgi:polyphosphate glucokinase